MDKCKLCFEIGKEELIGCVERLYVEDSRKREKLRIIFRCEVWVKRWILVLFD